MANAKWRTCDRAADAGAYCNSCAADIKAKALNPFSVDGGRGPPDRSSPGPPPLHSTPPHPVTLPQPYRLDVSKDARFSINMDVQGALGWLSYSLAESLN